MLTERRIWDAKATGKQFFLRDSQVKGFALRVTPAGSKAYIVEFRAAGRNRRETIGRPEEISLKDARARAAETMAAVRAGEASPSERKREAAAAPTVADLCNRFLTVEGPARIERGRMTERTVKEYGKQVRAYVLPAIGGLRVAEVKRGDIERMVDNMPGPTRNRVLALVSRLFTYAERLEWRGQRDNPCRGVERAREDARDRVFRPDELATLSAALEAEAEASPAAVSAIRFAALTGLRISEVLAVQWEHVEAETGRLLLPETKTGRRWHDLPEAALDMLAGLPRINGNPWAFTTGRNAPVTYRTARNVFARAAKAAGLDDCRLHDLRRTVITQAAADMGTHLLRDLLGHKTTAMAV